MKFHATPPTAHRAGANWLLRGFIILSLGIHTVIFTHISGLYRNKALTFIELTVNDVTEPPVRSIPRPRLRPKRPLQEEEVKRIPTTSPAIPHFAPIKPNPTDNRFPDSLMESIALPEVPGTPDLASVRWEPTYIEDMASEFDSTSGYLEMVRLRIEKQKSYPERAKSRQIEGAVDIRFIISVEGNVREEKIVKTSGHPILDEAALFAVRKAAPFPRPPRRLFKGEVPLMITIVFELT